MSGRGGRGDAGRRGGRGGGEQRGGGRAAGRGFEGGGRGDYGGRAGRGDRGGYGGGYGGERGGRAGGGRFEGGRGGRGGGGRFEGGGRGGRGGRGDGGGRGPQPLGPVGVTFPQGSAAHPGKTQRVPAPEFFEDQLQRTLDGLPDDIRSVGLQPRPRRVGFGREGKPIKVRANHFPVACALLSANHFDVTITGARGSRGEAGGESGPPRRGRPDAPTRPLPAAICRQVMVQLAEDEDWAAGWVFDGRKNIYAPYQFKSGPTFKFLSQDEQDYEVSAHIADSAKPRRFKVTIKWVAKVDVGAVIDFVSGQYAGSESPQDAIQALDVALKHGTALNPDIEAAARAFFVSSTPATPIGRGAEVWMGYNQSLRPCQAGLMLNVDTAATAFLAPQPLMNYLMGYLGVSEQGLSHMDQTTYRKANNAVKNLKVEVNYGQTTGGKRSYRVKGLTDKAADEAVFDNDREGTRMTVSQYYQQAYGIGLRYKQLPCLNVGRTNKEIWLPLEVCHLAKGQQGRMKLDREQQDKMVKVAAQPPANRLRWIQDCMGTHARLNEDPSVQAFGMEISNSMATVDARQLPPPELVYRDKGNKPKVLRVPSGAWNLISTRLHATAELGAFAVASFDRQDGLAGAGPDSDTSVEGFMYALLDMLGTMGLRVRMSGQQAQMPEIAWGNLRTTAPGDTIERAVQYCKQAFDGQAPRVIFVNLPTQAKDLYEEVKRATDSFQGIPSQCFVSPKAGIANPRGLARRADYLANLGMKINAKLGGTNVALSERSLPPWPREEDIMVFGADVTHPAGFSQGEPSVAALVGSLDRQLSRFASRIWVQGHRVEMMADLGVHFRALLMDHYHATNKVKPDRLIFYRDGVSEGQFAEVQQKELTQIMAVCRALPGGYNPKITYIVVQKRHHTRIFPQDPREADRNGNVLAGTVVDKGIVHPTERSFFLASHAGIQGTSRPTHYHVLYDSANLSPDVLQSFTYNMCYLFCRCTRSVSVCPPAYYAHLAAFRGRAMMLYSDSSASESSGTDRSVQVDMAAIHQKLQTSMFYV